VVLLLLKAAGCQSNIKMSEGEASPPINSIERAIPKTAERIPQLEVRRAAWEIAQFYRPPESAINKAMNSEVYIISAADIARISFEEINHRTGRKLTIEEAIKRRSQEIRKFNQSYKGNIPDSPNFSLPTLEEIMRVGAVCLQWDQGRSLVYLNEQAVKVGNKSRIRHELFHAMAMDPNGASGFVDADLSKGGLINEAVVESLDFFQRGLIKGRLSNIQFIPGGDSDKESPYYYELSRLGFILECTEYTQPITVFDVANIYFDSTKTSGERRDILRKTILERVDPQGAELPIEYFDKLVA
jgi:hypothetical protein